jgi:uncharacterized LabA/DUF88 family protein
MTKKERVIAYIDGYNLYFGLVESGYRRYLWLDVHLLIKNLLKPGQELVAVYFFTTLVTNDEEKRKRQKSYINALQTIENLHVVFGKFQKERTNCKTCGNVYFAEAEKMTDVNIATQIMCDYYGDRFDTAMVVSGDTDLVPPIKHINENDGRKRVMAIFPPNRANDEVRKHAKGDLVIGRKTLADSQLPATITGKLGETLHRPPNWT